jgi:hypothetical protein
MSFDPALYAALPPHQYGASMVDPFTGITIPKDPLENVRWRKKLLKAAASSPTVQKALKKACAASPIFWINAFGWTFLQKKIDETGKDKAAQGSGTHVPFITWWVQDQALMELMDAIDNGHHGLMHKSRDMGATWLVIAIFQWYWQFRPSTSFLEISRKEKLVDHRGDMDSLFEKHRYMIARQPHWLRPRRIVDREMHLENQDIGTSIEGESTNENAGQASRKTAAFVDEAARIRELESIDLALADTSPCIIYNSTPQGPATFFTRLYRSFKGGTRQGKLILLPFWMHPDKGRNSRVEKDKNGNDRVVSDWTKQEETKRTPRNIAQNVYGEHGKSGDMFFDADSIERHRKAYESAPLLAGAIQWIEDFNEEAKLQAVRKQAVASVVLLEQGGWNPWRFYVPLVNGRPNQQTRYVFGIDISNGSGASNSVITVLDHYSNMVVAKFWDAFTTPEDLAEEVAKAQIFFGGKKPARIIFEKNGPGISFGKKIVSKLSLPNIYYQEVVDGKTRTKTTKWGWHNSDTKKELLLRGYREALFLNEIINPCAEALNEALDYVYNDKGKIEPGHMGREEGGGTALHGDHVIADALVLIGRKDLPTAEKDETYKAPKGSPGFRRDRRQRRMREADAWAR